MDPKDKEIERLTNLVNEQFWALRDAAREITVLHWALRWHPLKRLRLWLWERKR
ncbi:hypothetical protein LCGC14_2206980 [marine sediment metagenome]|uniref:Uncharacterized protein n=1 Tax=marine sediment metagenome TaxID=412755 RepID=A0A0F9DEY9_9ZZZZ